jgi:hypothetical protein
MIHDNSHHPSPTSYQQFIIIPSFGLKDVYSLATPPPVVVVLCCCHLWWQQKVEVEVEVEEENKSRKKYLPPEVASLVNATTSVERSETTGIVSSGRVKRPGA